MAEMNERIKEMRLKCNLTLLEVAEHLGVKEATAQRYESGNIKNIKHETICQLAELFQCDPCYLMGWTDDSRTEQQRVAAVALTDDEKFLLAKFAELNREGQEKLLDYADDLVSSGKYIKNNQAGVGAAKMA